MKKMILFLISMILIPCVMTFLFSLFSEEVAIGNNNSLENRKLGKEVLIEINGLYKSMDVEEFVLGVLPGTIPADYDEETLKVQAILIRTNVLKEMQEKNTEDAADLSYQYLTVEERIALWGERNYEKYEKKFKQAVVETAGLVVEQENSLIMALYHEVSIGKTASAKEILGEDISYLQSVESSQDIEAKHYMNMICYTWQEIQELNDGMEETQGQENAEESKETSENSEETSENSEETTENSEGTMENSEGTMEKGKTETTAGKIAVSIPESSENGFVKQLSVGNTIYTGDEAMTRFDLASTNFYVEEVENGIRFVCLGKGNCLGVSQYGANRMALEGKKAEEIIKYYYKGVSMVNYGS